MKKRFSGALARVCYLLLIIGAGRPALAQVPSLDARLRLDVEDEPLEEVVRTLRRYSGANIVILEGGDTPVTLELSDVHWHDALDYAAELARCAVDESPSGVIEVSRPPYLSDYNFKDAPLRDVIENIARVAGANVIISPEVEGSVTLRLAEVPWRDALEVLCTTLGYSVVEERRGILRVADPATLEKQLVTRSYQLRYLRPRGNYVPVIQSEFVEGQAAPPSSVEDDFTVLKALKKALSPLGMLDFIDSQNVIILRDTPQVQDVVQEILRRLDVEPVQVYVDVKFVSTTEGALLNLGVDYGDAGPMASISGGQIPITFPFDLAGNNGFEDGMIVNNNGGPWADENLNVGTTVFPDTIFGALNFTQFQATLRLLQRDSSTEVIQAPKIVTLDGREATIFVGETIRYAEAKTEQGQAGGLSLSVTEAANSPVEVGFQLLIRPHVVPGTERIELEVIPKETSLSGTGSSALAPQGFDVFTLGASGLEGSIALPRTRSSTLVTNMMLDSGQTAVIGGLTTDSKATSESRVPFLSSIPLLGELFKHETDTEDRRSLMIFITPTILHGRDDARAILNQELERRDRRLREELDALIDGALIEGEAAPEVDTWQGPPALPQAVPQVVDGHVFPGEEQAPGEGESVQADELSDTGDAPGAAPRVPGAARRPPPAPATPAGKQIPPAGSTGPSG